MDKRFRTCDLRQIYLLPPSIEDWLPQDHLARFIGDVMNELDLSAIYAEYGRRDNRGLSAYHPMLLTRLLLYGYCIGVTSSRRLERATYDEVPFRYLAANQHPDHDTIASFRQRHLPALAQLFVQALRLCQKAGMVKLGNVSIDGTKIMANASTKRSVPYEKLREREQYWKQIVEQLLAEAQRTDQEEDRRYGPGQPADALPDKLADAQSRLEVLRKARAELEQEAQQELEALQQVVTERKRGRPRKSEPAPKGSELAWQQKTKKQLQRAKRKAAKPCRQHNFVDPDSRVMKDTGRKCFTQAYNAQAAVDAEQQVIVAAELTQQTTDRQQLLPMVQAVCRATGQRPGTVTGDAGYWDTVSLQDRSLEGIQVLVAPDSPRQDGDSLPWNAPSGPEAVAMRELLATAAGKAAYAKRKTTVEPVFGQIKEARGIRRFRLRSLVKAAAEWKLICAGHNLLKLYRHRTGQNKPKKLGGRSQGRSKPRSSAAFYRSHCHPDRLPTTSTLIGPGARIGKSSQSGHGGCETVSLRHTVRLTLVSCYAMHACR